MTPAASPCSGRRRLPHRAGRVGSRLPAWPVYVGAGLVLLHAPLGAQETSPSILSLLDPGNRRVAVGAPVTGTLSEGDHFLPDGGPVQAWAYAGEAGEAVTFDLVSGDFDAVLYLVGPGIDGLLSDDDGGGGCNSRISVTLPRSGRYLVVASRFGYTGPGGFTLSASREAGPPTGEGGCGAGSAWDPAVLESLDDGGRRMDTTGARSGRLSDADLQEDGSYLQAWTLDGRSGTPVTIDLLADDFDAFLLLAGPGLPDVASDDDGGGACNARLSLTLPADGPYRVVVSTVGDPGEGRFILRTSPSPGPRAEGACDTFADLLGVPDDDLSSLATADPRGRVHPGSGTVRGALSGDDQRYPGGGGPMQAWALAGTAGQTVVIDVRSAAFDPVVAFTGPGIPVPLTDDDGGEGLDSRLTVTLPATGEYRVVVTSVGRGTGDYTIEVTRVAP